MLQFGTGLQYLNPQEILQMERFEGKIALITGSGRGIGFAIAQGLAREGAKGIVINDIVPERARSAAKAISASHTSAFPVVADVSREDDIERMIEACIKEYGRLDILVNNAGIAQVASSAELPKVDWDKVIDTDLTGVFLCCKAAARYMMRDGGGKILNIGSINGLNAFPRRVAYGTAKAGVAQITRVLACEWAEWNIYVNAVAPGYTLTEMNEQLIEQGAIDKKTIADRVPLKRWAQVEEIAKPALFLLSNDANFITGVTLPVDGGWTAYGYI